MSQDAIHVICACDDRIDTHSCVVEREILEKMYVEVPRCACEGATVFQQDNCQEGVLWYVPSTSERPLFWNPRPLWDLWSLYGWKATLVVVVAKNKTEAVKGELEELSNRKRTYAFSRFYKKVVSCASRNKTNWLGGNCTTFLDLMRVEPVYIAGLQDNNRVKVLTFNE